MAGLHMLEQLTLVRQLADAAGDVDAYAATYLDDAIREPGSAAEVANRLLAAGRIAEAGAVLEAAGDTASGWASQGKSHAGLNFAWETSCIEYLEQSGQTEAAQAARWASFEATLSVERAKAFTKRLADFEDVEAENRAFTVASTHKDFQRGLAFLMDWPAIAEAGRMIEARQDDIRVTLDQVEAWAPTQTTGPLKNADVSTLRTQARENGVTLVRTKKIPLHGKFLAWDDDDLAVTSLNWAGASPRGQDKDLARGSEGIGFELEMVRPWSRLQTRSRT